MKNVLFVTDPLHGLVPEVDATVGLMIASQAEGATIWVCEPDDLTSIGGRVVAVASNIRVRPGRRTGDHRWLVEKVWWHTIEQRRIDLAKEVDLVQMRIDPPIDSRYLHTTYLLDLVGGSGTPVVNRPSGIRVVHEKVGALAFPALCPETVVSADPETLRSFVIEKGEVVVKPIDGFAGMDVWLVQDNPGAKALLESATQRGTRHVIAQPYLGDVVFGNKRLFVLDGDIIGSVIRLPIPEDFRIGPPVADAKIDDADRKIVDTVAPTLAANGIRLAGLDVISGRLIEINVTCPGGMHKTDALLGTDLSGVVMRRLLQTERVFA